MLSKLRPFGASILFAIITLWLCLLSPAIAYESQAQPLGSLQSYTGILFMPNARVEPDWSIRIKSGHSDPYTYYGGALGVFNIFEFHGQFTQVNTIEGFPGFNYGDYKDRNAGMRMVLLKENEFWPQVSIGFYDAIGTGLFPFRYLVASKMVGNVDLTVGLGQGILADDDFGQSLIFSTPFRKTKPFFGVEWHINPRLSFSAEYSSINWGNMYGYRDTLGTQLKNDDTLFDVNLGVKYKLTNYLHASAALIGGNSFAGSMNLEFPLEPEGMLPWEKSKPYTATEKLHWNAYEANNEELSSLVAEEIKQIGFSSVSVACSQDSVWVEFDNKVHLSDARAIGRIAVVLEKLLPQRIQLFYINLRKRTTVISSLRVGRKDLKAFLESNIDDQGLMAYADFSLYKSNNWKKFNKEASVLQSAKQSRLSYHLQPKIRTFINNRSGFFKHKGVLRAKADYRLWRGGALLGTLEYTLFNEYDELIYDPLETDNAVRTDLQEYETGQELRLSTLAFNQFIDLPLDIQGRFSAGYFETMYAGIGVECFRYFNNGLWGIGFDSQMVKKRDPNSTFKIHESYDDWYKTFFLNVYAEVIPSLGLELGLKIGRFLAGDPGVRIDLRRTYKYFTIGAWFTKTDTDLFVSEKNRQAEEKGVYISFPLSIFSNKDRPERLRYNITSFTKDQGATVYQPGSLYPLAPFSTPDNLQRTLNEMRQ